MDLSLSSSPGGIDTVVDVNSATVLSPGNAYSWSGYINLPQLSLSSGGTRYIGYSLTNYDSTQTANVQITLTVTRFGSNGIFFSYFIRILLKL